MKTTKMKLEDRPAPRNDKKKLHVLYSTKKLRKKMNRKSQSKTLIISSIVTTVVVALGSIAAWFFRSSFKK